jgi:ATP-dependent DNA helicase 2 subunit 2
MAEKEAIVFIVDLGSTMANCNSGRSESDLDWSMRYVWDKISHIVSLSRKGLCVAVLGLRTSETRNSMGDDPGYQNISVLQEMGPMDMASLRALQGKIRAGEETMGDAISAVALGVQMIIDYTKRLKYKRQIYLITDGLGPIDIDDGDSKEIAAQLDENWISLTVL